MLRWFCGMRRNDGRNDRIRVTELSKVQEWKLQCYGYVMTKKGLHVNEGRRDEGEGGWSVKEDLRKKRLERNEIVNRAV